jgi:predicted transcriptional regulator
MKTEVIQMVKEFKLSEKGAKALAFLKANHGEYTAAELALEIDAEERGIAATMRPLVNNNLVYSETREIPFLEEDANGAPVEVLKTMKTYAVTQDGLDFVVE